ncbi:MAG: hypothetical protein AAGC73_08345 [Verrucomicrobiota bacterium]
MPRSKPPSFRNFDDPDRREPYGWDYGHGSGRRYPTFKTKQDKLAFKKRFIDRWHSERYALLSFDEREWAEMRRLKRRLGRATLEEAVDFFLEYGAGKAEMPLFSARAADRIKDLERKNSANVDRIDKQLRAFVDFSGDRGVHLYTREDVQAFADRLAKQWARQTVVNYLACVQKVFNDCVLDGLLVRSPAQRITLPSTRGEKRMVLIEPEDLRRLLVTAWEIDRPMAGLLAILFFLGMRISMIAVPPAKRANREFLRLDMFDFEHRVIVIPGGIMKSEADLIIEDAPECLWGWLADLRKKDFGMPQNSFNQRKRMLCREAGVRWAPNLHRRSAASYLAAMIGEERAAGVIGDRDRAIFVKHYKVPAFRRTAAAYFDIRQTF